MIYFNSIQLPFVRLDLGIVELKIIPGVLYAFIIFFFMEHWKNTIL